MTDFSTLMAFGRGDNKRAAPAEGASPPPEPAHQAGDPPGSEAAPQAGGPAAIAQATPRDLVAEALALPEAEREALIAKLRDSLTPAELEAAGLTVLVRATAVPSAPAASAVAPTTAVAEAVAVELAEPVKVAVVVQHLDSAHVFRGLVGKMDGDEFVIDPDYRDIAYIFRLQSRLKDAQVIEVPFTSAADLAAFKANMIQGSQKNWTSLYERVKSHASSDRSAILDADAAESKAGVARYVAQSGMRTFKVPVAMAMHVAQCDERPADDPSFRVHEMDLLSEGTADWQSIELFPLDPAVEFVAIDPDADLMVPSPPLPANLREHTGGFDLQVRGSVSVLASDPEQAKRMSACLLDNFRHAEGIARNVLTIAPESIENVALVPYEAFVDDDDDGYGRETYR